MCHRGETKEVVIDGKSISIDRCLAPRVELLQEHGIKTLGSCYGHGRYHRTIIVEVDGHIIEYFTEKIIPRKKRFYRRDAKRIFFLPEVDEEMV
jgi:hypothetical protein